MFWNNNCHFKTLFFIRQFIIFYCFITSSNAATEKRLYEGDTCNMGNRRGICTRESQCKSLEEEVRSKSVNLDEIRCGFTVYEALVCCKQLLTVDTHSTSIEIGSRPAKVACDKIQNDLHLLLGGHVLNGEKVDYGEMPFLVGLGYTNEINDKIEYRCGGTLIHPRFVLTAAHCADLFKSNLTTVRLGINNVTDENEIRDGLFLNVKKIYIHCNYSLGYHDIAIIEMERDAYTGSGLRNIRATCLNLDDNAPSPGSDVLVAGWGVINDLTRATSTVLLKGKVQTVDLAKCNQSYYTANSSPGFGPTLEPYGLLPTHLCAYDSKLKVDSCKGDSGGPLIQTLDEATGDYRITGVISQGYGCAEAIPAIYTRVSAYIDFIEDIVWKNKPYKCQ